MGKKLNDGEYAAFSPILPPMFPVFSRNGRILPMEQATASLQSVEYAYGFGVYETLRAVKGVPYFLEDHLRRLERSAEIIGIRHPFSAGQTGTWVRELLAAVPADALNLKILLVGAPDPQDAQLSILPLAPAFPKDQWYRDGIAVRSVVYERLFPHAKSLNMLGSYLAYREARAEDCYDALLVDREGCVTEGTRTNVFFVRGERAFSPPAEKVLEGVSGRVLRRIAPAAGVEIAEAEIPLAEIASFDGAFLTSTSTKVMPIARIDTHAYPPAPPAVRRLQQEYDRFLRDCKGSL